ncbi:hypothetical protein HED60_10065 [Planctomycetales bacterium ZRK34]|nr:hypothetical protein HED60_10065 [Planctomycetales bacterium ZRK34]
MSDPILHPEQVDDVVRPARGWKRAAAYIVGLGLLAASVYLAVNKADWSHLRQADRSDIALLCALVVANVLTNALLFWLATKPFEVPGQPVKLREWLAMVAGTALLNYAGAKAGLIGRIAYLKKYHGISYRANVFTLVALAAGTASIYILIAAILLWRDGVDTTGLTLGTLALVVLSLVGWLFIKPAVGRFGAGQIARRDLPVWIFVWSILRIVDAVVYAGRLMIASHVLGKPIDLELALTAAVVCNFVVMAAPVPGGLGIREWLGAAIVKWGFKGAVVMDLAQGAGILVVDRVAEVVTLLALGPLALLYLHYRANKIDNNR